MLAIVLRYIASAAPGLTREEFQTALRIAFPHGEGLIMKTLAEGWLEEGLAKGKEEGLQQGHSEAASSQRRIILRILQRRFQFSNDDVVRFAEQLARVNDLDQLAQLIDYALDVVVLTDFNTKLKQYLP